MGRPDQVTSRLTKPIFCAEEKNEQVGLDAFLASDCSFFCTKERATIDLVAHDSNNGTNLQKTKNSCFQIWDIDDRSPLSSERFNHESRENKMPKKFLVLELKSYTLPRNHETKASSCHILKREHKRTIFLIAEFNPVVMRGQQRNSGTENDIELPSLGSWLHHSAPNATGTWNNWIKNGPNQAESINTKTLVIGDAKDRPAD